MKSVAFHFSPKIQLAFGLGLIETMSPRTTFENRPIWSHWTRMKIEIFDLQRERERAIIFSSQMMDVFLGSV